MCGYKGCPFNGVTNHSSVWRKGVGEWGWILIDDCLYSAILRSRADSLRSHVILREWLAFYNNNEWLAFYNNNNILYSSQREIKAVVRSHNEEHNNSKSWNTRIYALLRLPFSQSAYTSSKPQITWNNVFSVKLKRKNSQIKSIRFTHPQPSLKKLSSSTDV